MISLFSLFILLITLISEVLTFSGPSRERWLFPDLEDPFSEESLNDTLRSVLDGADVIRKSEIIHFPGPNFLTHLSMDASETVPQTIAISDEESIGVAFKLFERERHHQNEKLKDAVRKDILNHFQKFGFQTFEQKFLAQSKKLVSDSVGYNLIAVYPGRHRGTSQDRVLLLGGHYDTMPGTSGIDDNGSGCVALLEMARLIGENRPVLNHTIYLVAFDFEESGLLGSKAFVSKYLIPVELEKRKSKFLGAYITDMILAYDTSPNSQTFPSYFDSVAPEAVDEAKKGNWRGDFICIWMRKNVDNLVYNAFKTAYDAQPGEKFRQIPVSVDMPTISEIAIQGLPNRKSTFLRSDHAAFWYPKRPNFPSLNAILLTDMGPWRSYQNECYHRPCDNSTQISPEKLSFMRKTINALYDVFTRNPPQISNVTRKRPSRRLATPRWTQFAFDNERSLPKDRQPTTLNRPDFKMFFDRPESPRPSVRSVPQLNLYNGRGSRRDLGFGRSF